MDGAKKQSFMKRLVNKNKQPESKIKVEDDQRTLSSSSSTSSSDITSLSLHNYPDKTEITFQSHKAEYIYDGEGEDDDNSLQSADHYVNLLQERHPRATLQECHRFLLGRKFNRANDKMTSYMQWREENKLDELLSSTDIVAEKMNDRSIWNQSVNFAMSLNPSDAGSSSSLLPQIVRFSGEDTSYMGKSNRTKEGKRIIQVLPALIDTKLASLKIYANAIAYFLELKLDRQSSEQITVIVDVRAGKGWPNASPMVLLPFIKRVTKILADNFPERMASCIVYPIPAPAIAMWNVVKTFLDPKHVAKIKLISGMALTESEAPKKLVDLLGDECVDVLEKARRDEFIG
jgi:hypothetical protein